MTQEALLAELEAIAEHASVKVSYESLQASIGAGGLCRVRGQYRIIIEKRAQVGERLATLAQGLAQLDLSAAQPSPAVRGLLQLYAPRRAS